MPPYRLSTPKYLFANTIGLSVLAWGIKSILIRTLPEQLAEAGHWQFLTNLSLVLTAVAQSSNYLTILTDVDVFRKLNVALNAAALVAETLVSSIYWTLKLFFMPLIIPENVPKQMHIPLHLDLAIHLFPVMFLSADYYFNRTDSFGLPPLLVLALVITLSGGYWCVLEALVKPPAHYPYPFLNADFDVRLKIFSVVAILGFVFYQVYEYFHAVVKKALYEKIKAE